MPTVSLVVKKRIIYLGKVILIQTILTFYSYFRIKSCFGKTSTDISFLGKLLLMCEVPIGI